MDDLKSAGYTRGFEKYQEDMAKNADKLRGLPAPDKGDLFRQINLTPSKPYDLQNAAECVTRGINVTRGIKAHEALEKSLHENAFERALDKGDWLTSEQMEASRDSYIPTEKPIQPEGIHNKDTFDLETTFSAAILFGYTLRVKYPLMNEEDIKREAILWIKETFGDAF